MVEETVRELLDRAYSLYDKGEWSEALDLLKLLRNQEMYNATSIELAEATVLEGWNYWKKGEKVTAEYLWQLVLTSTSTTIVPTRTTEVSAHAGLAICCAEEGEKEEALEHAQLAQDLLPMEATINQVMNLNACGITMAKIGELERAEEILQKVAKINERLEKSDNPEIARKAKHQRAKNGYNLASLILIPQRRWNQALYELLEEVIPRYDKVNAETDLAAAYHRVSEVWMGKDDLDAALLAEKSSEFLWEKHQKDAPGRVETSRENIRKIELKKLEKEEE